MELQKAILPTLPSLTTHKILADQCLLLDRELKRIKERSERINKNRPTTMPRPTTIAKAPKKTIVTTTSSTTSLAPPTYASAMRTRPTYGNLERQALSRAGACFKCHQQGHIARDYLTNVENKVIEEGV